MERNVYLLLYLSATCPILYGDLLFQGISPQQYDLISYADDATCLHHKPYLCGSFKYTDQVNITIHPDVNDIEVCTKKLQCPDSSQYSSSCFSHDYVVPELTYQFVHTEMNPGVFKYNFSWEPLPDECNVQYYLAIYSENYPDEKWNDTCAGYFNTKNCFPLIVSNSSNQVSVFFESFRNPSTSDDITVVNNVLTRYFKLIAYPVYEWPTVEFQIPGRCPEKHSKSYKSALGCSSCFDDCTAPSNPVQDFQVVYTLSSDNSSLSANVSWQSNVSAVRYYLHVNSSTTKYLYWFTEDVSQFTMVGMDGSQTYEIWLEYFYCDCSPSTEIFVFTPDESAQIVPSYSTGTPDSTQQHKTSTWHSTSPVIHSSVSVTYSVSMFPSETVAPPNISIDVITTLEPSPSPHTNESRTTVYIYTTIPVVSVLIVTVLVVIIAVIVTRQHRKSISCGAWYTPKPTVIQPQPLTVRNVTSPALPTKVMLIYSTETKEKKLLEILTFLDNDLGSLHDEHGQKLFEVCKYDTSTERDHPSEWLDKNFRYCDYVICIVGKKFKREWNDEVRPDTPLVYAFHQLFNASFSSTANPLSKIVVVLRNKPKDEKHIPSQYLQGRKTYSLDDTDGLASYMLGRPRHIFHGGESTSTV